MVTSSGCYNEATVGGRSSTSYGAWCSIGGIVGGNNASVINCYNAGSITYTGGWQGFIGGIIGRAFSSITNAYNIGSIPNSDSEYRIFGGVMGSRETGGSISAGYCTTESSYLYRTGDWGKTKVTAGRVEREKLKTYASTLGEAFTNDIQNKDGTWKYNDGFPILSWQIEANLTK